MYRLPLPLSVLFSRLGSRSRSLCNTTGIERTDLVGIAEVVRVGATHTADAYPLRLIMRHLSPQVKTLLLIPSSSVRATLGS